MQSMASLLERIRQTRGALTGSERRIAAESESGYPHAGLEGATPLAAKFGASAATVVRFAAKLGYRGYPDLQRELRSQVEARLVTPLQRLNQTAAPAIPQAGALDVPQRTLEAAMNALTRSFGAFDRYTLESIASALAQAKGRVFVHGQKKGSAIAIYLYAQLNLCRGSVVLLSTDAGFEGDQLLDIGPDDVLIAVDVRRYVKRVVDSAEFALSRGARLVVLSDSAASPLFGATPMRLCAATAAVSAFDSYVGLILAADILTNMVVAGDPDLARDRIARGEEAWRDLAIFSAPPSAA
jgi:DNA-binding MurR/RpiR family transcriptional regulator